jgi:ABC-2 type transport system permease protein
MHTLRDTLLIFRRQLTLSLRNPAWVMIGLTQPILYFVLFGPLLRDVVTLPGFTPGSTWQQIFVPALLVQLGLFGAAFVGFTIIAELRNGVVERMRVTPASRLALLMGRVLRDVVTLLVQSLVLVAVGVAFGLRAPVVGVLIAMGFVLLLAVAMASLSYAVGLILRSEDALAPLLNTVAVPVLLLSGILLPIGPLAPSWLNAISHANPFRYVVDGMRDAFIGHYTTTAMWTGLGVAIAVATIAVLIGTRTFRAENA